MGKYLTLYTAIYSIFATVEWTGNSIKTYPSDFTETAADNEFIRISVIPGGFGVNRRSISGIMIVDIFTASGFGPKRYLEIADILDSFLENKTLTVSTGVVVQFENSSMGKTRVDSHGRDVDNSDASNPSLVRTQYLIPFNYNGVL